MAYHQFRASNGEPYGSFETFHLTAPPAEPGWYWWACFPGCIPDGDPAGPFTTEEDAINDASEVAV